MAAVDIQLPELFGHEQCKRIEEENCLCLKLKAHNPKMFHNNNSVIVRCEKNRISVEIVRGSVPASYIVKPQELQLCDAFFIMNDGFQLRTRTEIFLRSCNLMAMHLT